MIALSLYNATSPILCWYQGTSLICAFTFAFPVSSHSLFTLTRLVDWTIFENNRIVCQYHWKRYFRQQTRRVPYPYVFSYFVQEGIARFGTDKFDLNQLNNVFSHLTNTSINKYGPSYAADKERVGPGCKWTLSQVSFAVLNMETSQRCRWAGEAYFAFERKAASELSQVRF